MHRDDGIRLKRLFWLVHTPGECHMRRALRDLQVLVPPRRLAEASGQLSVRLLSRGLVDAASRAALQAIEDARGNQPPYAHRITALQGATDRKAGRMDGAQRVLLTENDEFLAITLRGTELATA